jgi:hypothetical protein
MSYLTSPIAGALLAGGVRNSPSINVYPLVIVLTHQYLGLLRTFQSHANTVRTSTSLNLLKHLTEVTEGLNNLEESTFSNFLPTRPSWFLILVPIDVAYTR